MKILYLILPFLLTAAVSAQPVGPGPSPGISSISPAFTGTPTAPTQTAGDSSTKLSTTAFGLGGPSFSASRITSQQSFTSATWTTLIFNSASVNIGSGYNTTTGKFTPLVSGTYMCSASGTFATSGTFTSAENVFISLTKNGAPGVGTIIVEAQTAPITALTQTDAVTIPGALISMNGSTDTLEVDANVTTASGSPSFIANNGLGFTCVRVSQ